MLACDMFYRKGIPDHSVDTNNEAMRQAITAMDAGQVLGHGAEDEGTRGEAVVDPHMLVDHIHVDERWCRIWT